MKLQIRAGEASAAFSRLADKFEEYKRYTSKTCVEAIAHHAKETVEAIFILTPRASAAVIKAKLDSLGWRFIRAPKGYAKKFKGRDSSSDTKAATALRQKILSELNVRRKPNQSKADAMRLALDANPELAQAFKKAERLTLAEQKNAAYNFRVAHIGAMASSWIPAMRQLGSKMKVAGGSDKRVKMRPMSSLEIADEGKTIRIVNQMNGIVALAERTGFVEAGFVMRERDMQVYINRKMREGATIFNPSGAR